MGELTGLQRAFINAWFGEANFNGTEAARLAGYGGDGANDNVWAVTASNLLKTPSVVEEVNRRFSLLRLSNDEALRGLAEAVQNGSKYRTKRVAGFVYLFRAENGLIKIGKAVDVKSRLKRINTASPIDIELVAIIESTEAAKLEKRLHRELDAYRVKGEWFALTDKHVKDILERHGKLIWQEDGV